MTAVAALVGGCQQNKMARAVQGIDMKNKRPDFGLNDLLLLVVGKLNCNRPSTDPNNKLSIGSLVYNRNISK